MSRRIDFRQVAQSPKSTLIGLCVLALAAERGVHFDAAGHLAMSARDWFGVGCGVLTAVISGLTQDAVRNTQGHADPAAPEAGSAAVSGGTDL